MFRYSASRVCRRGLPGWGAQGASELPADANGIAGNVQFVRGKGLAVRKDVAGRILWSAALEGEEEECLRPPNIVAHGDRVCLAHGGGVTCLDLISGRLIWRVMGANNRMCLDRELLYATGWTVCKDRYDGYLIARSVATGNEAFRVPLPADFDPEPIRIICGYVLVQDFSPQPSRDGSMALIVDKRGKVVQQLGCRVVDGKPAEDGLILLTSTLVERVGPAWETRWSQQIFKHSMAEGGVIALPGQDLLVYLYEQMRDSGIDIVRLDSRSGKIVWSTHCADGGPSFRLRAKRHRYVWMVKIFA